MRIDLEKEYDNRARVPAHGAIMAGWERDAADYRAQSATRHRVIRYGETPRQMIDLFMPEKPRPGAMPVLFIHGGYWQMLQPSLFSHLAKGLNAHGVTVGIAGYDLCPDVSISQINEQMIKAAVALFRDQQSRIVVSGHSAGGHLAACLAAAAWEDVDSALPENMVAAGLAISGLFELEPLVPTSVNAKLGLDFMDARMLSPRLWLPPVDMTFEAWVGSEESTEYHRQSQGIAAVWSAAGNKTAYVEVPGANHFTVVEGLADRASPMTMRLAEMAAGTSA
jgi:arylformamidase